VAARHLKKKKRRVRVLLLGGRSALKGDAAAMAKKWTGEVAALSVKSLRGSDVVVDALFGAGLSRPLDGVAKDVVLAANASFVPIVAVDVPSGISGDLGRALEGKDGVSIRAARTVTFFRKKPAHLLMPSRTLCGEIILADIGIPDTVLDKIKPTT